MALVQLTDAYIPQVYATMTSVDSPEKTAFFSSGVAVTNEALINAFSAGGSTVDLPFWNDLDDTAEPNYGTDSPTDLAVPDKVGSAKMVTRIADLNKWYSDANLVTDLSGSDPMQHIKNRFGTWWTRQWQKRLLALCKGLYNANVAQNAGDMVVDVSIPAGLSATSANLMSGTAFVNALYTMGDAADQIVAVAVHSVVEAQMVKNNMIQYFKPSENEPAIGIFMGKQVIVDDGMPVVAGATNGFVYTSILFGKGAIGYAEGVPSKLPTEVLSEPLKGNGAGVQSIGERKRWIIHPFGYQFTNNTVSAGTNATNANLTLAANWARVVTRKLVPMTFLRTNG
jgi:hypothetical protein